MPELELHPADRFASLDDLRSAHADLLQAVSEEDLTPEDADRVRQFLRRAAATGTVLDTAADRKQAQGVLDYWTATLYGALRQRPPASAVAERLPAAVTTLAGFDSGTVGAAAEEVGRWFQSLPAADQELVHRILLRFVRLPPDGRSFATTTVPRSVFHALGPPAKVDELLEGLQAAR